MGSKDRRGAIKDRNKKTSNRPPSLGYYLIITDTNKTEKNYFDGLKNIIPENLENRLVIKIQKVRTIDLIEKCKELISIDPQFRIPWIILDRDQVKGFDEIISEADKCQINVGWSNPCIEIWFHAYLGKMPTCMTSTQCCEKFEDKFLFVTDSTYQKWDVDIYKKLNQYGDELKAFKIANQRYVSQCNDIRKPSEMYSVTTVYKLIEEIRGKIDDK